MRSFAYAWLAAIFPAAVFLAGCIHRPPVGYFAPEAFYHSRSHYRVRYDRGERPHLLGDAWTLENYRSEGGELVAVRADPRFWTVYDARALSPRSGSSPIRAERFDLVFAHRERNATVWARTLPLTPPWSRSSSLHLAHAGTYGLDGRWGPIPNLLGLSEARHEVRVHRERPTRVDGRLGYAMTIDLVQTADPERLPSRVTFVVVRPPRGVFREGRIRVPAIVVFGCTSAPEHHDEALFALESLVRRVDFRP